MPSPFVAPWIKAADPVGNFEAGVDLALKMRQAKDRRDQQALMMQYRQSEVNNATDRMNETAAHHRALEQSQQEVNGIKQQLADANTAYKAARTEDEKQMWADKVDNMKSKLELANRAFEAKNDYLTGTLDLKNRALDHKQDYDSAVLDLRSDAIGSQSDAAANRDKTLSGIADQKNETSGFSSIFNALQREDAAKQAADQKYKPQADSVLADKAFDIWDSIKAKRASQAALTGQTASPAVQTPPIASPAGAAPPVSPAVQNAPAQGNPGVKVRNKQTGQTFIYSGNPADIPTNQFDLVQ